MHVTVSGHITVPVQVDGHRLQALLDTGASNLVMSLRVATGTFHLAPGETGVEEVGHLEKAGSKIYVHRFNTLSIEGITVNNPTFELLPDMMRNFLHKAPPIGTHIPVNDEAEGLPDVLIGMPVLKHLHVYIAYKEQMLYITAGE